MNTFYFSFIVFGLSGLIVSIPQENSSSSFLWLQLIINFAWLAYEITKRDTEILKLKNEIKYIHSKIDLSSSSDKVD